MPDENVIGGVKVQVEGDISPLEKDFQEAVALAVQAGSTLAEAMQSAMPILNAAPVTTAFQQVDTAATAAGNDIQTAGQQAKGTATIFEQLGAILKGETQGFQQFAQGVENFISHPLQFAGAQAKDFLLAIGPIGGIALAGAAAMATLGQEALSLVQEFGAAAEQTGNLADRLNLTWRETRNLEEMGKIAGVSVQSLGAASFRLAEAFDSTSKQGQKIAATLQSIGVTGSTSGELLRGFLEKLSKIPNETERIRLAHEVLGRSSAQIIPLIKNFDELKRAIEEVGPAINDLQAKDLQAADDAMDKLGLATSRFKEQLAAALAPAIMTVVDGIRELVVDMSKLTTETIGTTKALLGMIPPQLVSTLQEIGGAVIWIHTHLNPFIAALRVLRVALDEFNLVGATVAHKTIPEMDAALRDKIGKTIQQTTESTREYLNIWKNQGGGSKQIMEDIISQHEKLSARVRDSRKAYEDMKAALDAGTTVLNGYRVTAGDVAQALSNLKAAEAAATTTKMGHVEATKHLTASFRTMMPAIQMLVDVQKQEEGILNRAITQTASYNRVMREMIEGFRDLTPVQLAAKHLEDFRKNIEELNKEAPMLDMSAYSPIFVQTATDIDGITKSLNKLRQEELDTSPEGKLTEALKELGIKSAAYYEHQVDVAQQAYDTILETAGDDYHLIDQASAELALRQAQYALRMGEITQDVYDDLVKAIKHDLDELDGTAKGSADKRGRYERTLGEELVQINDKTFKSISRGLADSIVELKGFGDIWKTLWKGLAKDLLDIMITTLLNPLKNKLNDVLGSITGGGGGGGGIPGVGGGGGAASGAAAAAGSMAASAVVGMITGGITAAMAVVGMFQNMHQETSLNAIEHNTRYAMMYLGERADGGILGVMFRVLDQVSFGVIVKAAEESRNILGDIRSILQSGGGMGHSGAAAVAVASGGGSMAAGYGVNVDLRGAHLSGDLTDSQVRDVFDRGIRKSKLAGAFRPGVFPQ